MYIPSVTSVLRLAGGALAALAFTAAGAQPITVQQFGVTAVNSTNNALYDLTVTPATPPATGVLINGTQVFNTDGASYRSFEDGEDDDSYSGFAAVARVPNSVTSALDLIVADERGAQILRYPGPGPASYATATPIYTFKHAPSP
jgi:hypothetical protein